MSQLIDLFKYSEYTFNVSKIEIEIKDNKECRNLWS